MIREDNSYINMADYEANSHVDYYKKTLEYGIEAAKGNVPNVSIIQKFGRNTAVSSTFVPICLGGFYRTPTTNTALEVVSTDADDNASGAGARTIYYEGLQESNGSLVVVSDVVELDGLTPVALPDSLIRLYRWYVASSGVYATQSVGSHQGDLTIQESGGGSVWAKIENNGFPRAQSQIAAYTVPSGYTAYVSKISYSVESDKEADILMFKREGVLNTTAPYNAMTLVTEINSATGNYTVDLDVPYVFEEETDLGFIGKLKANTGPMTIDFTIYLIQNG
jgi:hypothetical protein